MLAPQDRLLLSEQLRPEPDEDMDLAVATTFTLDLESALNAPLGFAAHALTRTADPITVLETIRRVADRVMVFCQAGHMRVPKARSDLMAFLESMVHEVTAPLPGFLFHPKIWVVRYIDSQGSHSFRLLCGTRNLTGDASWDALLRLDGHPGTRPLAANRPIVDFITALPGLTVTPLSDHRRAEMEALADQVRYVEWDLPADVKDVSFHVLGLRRMRSEPSIVSGLQGVTQLVVSPFLDEEGLRTAVGSADPVTVVSRAESFELLPSELLADLNCRVVSPLAGLDESDEDEAVAPDGRPTTSLLGGLHAKVYVTERGRNASVIVGSPNATSAGLGNHNVEFAVELFGGRKALGVDGFLGPEAPFAALLEPYHPTGDAQRSAMAELERDVDRLLRRVASDPLVAVVTPEDGAWTETVEGTEPVDLPPQFRLRVRLMTIDSHAVGQEHGPISASFRDVSTPDVTPFVVLEVAAERDGLNATGATVVRAELRGDPPDRLDEIIARTVDTPEKFARFLALLLGLPSDLLPVSTGEGQGSTWFVNRIGSTGLFEQLVRAVADRPRVIEDIGRLVDRLQSTERGRTVLPEGFTELWSTVVDARNLLVRP